MSHTLQNLTTYTSTPSSPFPEPVFQHSEQPCQDPRPQQRGALTEPKASAKLKHKNLKRSLNWTDENGRCRMLTDPFYETGIQLQSQRMERCKANQVTGQTQREKSWLCNELEMRSRAFQENRAKKLSRNWWITKNLLCRSWESHAFENWWTFCAEGRKRICSGSAYGANSGTARHGKIPWLMRKNSELRKLRAAHFPSQTYEYSESTWTEQPRVLLAACCTELSGHNRTRFFFFWRSACSRWTIISTLGKFEEFGISLLRICTYGYRKDCGASLCVGKRPSESCNTHTTICQEVFDLESSLSCGRNLSSNLKKWVAKESNFRVAFQ